MSLSFSSPHSLGIFSESETLFFQDIEQLPMSELIFVNTYNDFRSKDPDDDNQKHTNPKAWARMIKR